MKSDSVKNLPPTPKPEVSPKIIENLRKSGLNKQCFDCAEKNTSYAVIDFGTFVCHRCALFHKELSHSIKDLGTSKFYESDQHILMKYGNEKAKNLWMEKFDTKKEKIPKTKDSIGFKKFLSEKYLGKKYASKDLEKELTLLKIEKNSPKQPISEPISSSDDSSTPKENSKIWDCNSAASSKEDHDKHRFEISEVNVNHADDNTINYPKMSNFCHANLIEPSSPGVPSHILRKNGQNNNLFFFENFNTPCDNNVDLKDWGIIWDNQNKVTQENEKKLNECVLDKEESSTTKGKENFNLLCDEKNISTPKDWDFPVDLDMVNQNTHTTTSSTTSPDNMTSLSQNLNGIYSNYTSANTNSSGEGKKTFDDLERYLCDPGFTTPANKKPAGMPLHINQNQGMKNNFNMNMMGHNQNMPYNNSVPTMSPQMMMNYSYNINQTNNNFQMYSGNDFARSNVQEYSCSYNGNSSTSTYGSKTPSGPAIENLSFNFNLLNVNPQEASTQNTVGNTNGSTRANPVKYDAFKDIYNYSKNTKSSSNKSSDNNVTSALKNGEQNNFNNKPLTIGFNSNNVNNNLNNPFDF